MVTRDANGVFPTRVGMNRRFAGQCGLHRSIPHTRGDEPQQLADGKITVEYSPHAWG